MKTVCKIEHLCSALYYNVCVWGGGGDGWGDASILSKLKVHSCMYMNTVCQI